jgi:hypothetical protein
MKFDANKLRKLTEQGVLELWLAIKSIAAASGLSLPDAPPPPNEMAKLRTLLNGAEKMSPTEAAKIVNDLKKRGNG